MNNLTMSQSMPEPLAVVSSSLILTSAGHYAHAPGRDMVRQSPSDALVIWLFSGRGHAETQGVASDVQAGDLLVFEPDQPQLYRSDHRDPWEIFWVHFTGRQMRAYLDALRCYAKPFTRIGLDTTLREGFDDLIMRLSEHPDMTSREHPRPDMLAGHLLASLLGRMLHLLDRERSRPTDIGSRLDTAAIRRYINRHLADPMTLEELAAVNSLSVTHLSRLFRQHFGVSPMRYVAQQRLARAATMLSETCMPVNQVALSVGYDDPYHFSRLFKRHLGRSPQHWREAQRR